VPDSASPSAAAGADVERDVVVGVVDFAGLPVVVVVDSDDDEVPAEDRDFGAVVPVVDFGRVVVVVDVGGDFDVEADDLVVVVVGDDFVDVEPDDLIVVVVVGDDFVDVVPLDPEDFAVVVVVGVDFEVDFVPVEEAGGFVVDVVAAVGTLGSSLAGASSRAWVGPPAAGAAGDPGGGGIRSSRRAYCMIRANTGADTWPP